MKNPTTRARLIDISVDVSSATPLWPNAQPFELVQKRSVLGDGQIVTSSIIKMTPHCGTHIDAPLHFADGGETIDALRLDALVGPCSVFEHLGDNHIAKCDLDAMGFVPTRRVLFKTRNSTAIREGTLGEDFLSLLPDAIDHLVQSGVEVLGVDGLSIGPYGELTDRNHVKFCGAGGIIIEVLDLFDVEPGNYNLVALPVKLKGVEGAPARAFLFRAEDSADIFTDGRKPLV